MRFIAANTTIPVPRVHATRTTEWGTCEIIMDYVPGEPLDRAWTYLTHDQKVTTCVQLRGYLAQLKRLKGKRIESLGGGAVTVGLRFPKQGGPFDNEMEFNNFMVEERNRLVPEFFKRYARAALTHNHDIHFAHADFSPRNILVDEYGRVNAVLDWDRAGWYPEYWDQTRILSENPGVQGYWDYIEHIISFQYVAELVALTYVYHMSGDG